jgi:hypothetical protein
MLKGTNEEISAGTGGRVAGPIAKAMLDRAFSADAAAAVPAPPAPAEATADSTPAAPNVPAPEPTTGPSIDDGAGG